MRSKGALSIRRGTDQHFPAKLFVLRSSLSPPFPHNLYKSIENRIANHRNTADNEWTAI